jgi:lysophospholipase L1-like esterase
VAVLGLFALVLALVGARGAFVGPGRQVVLVGDSLTLVSTPALHVALGRDNDVTTEARLGVTVAMMQPVATELAASGPDHAVIELGTNDVLQDVPVDTTAEQLEQMVATFRAAGAGCIHIVDVDTRMRRGDGRWTTARAAALNQTTAALAAGNDDVVVIGWDAALREAEARGEDLTPDTVHPDRDGARLLAELVATSLAEGCAD